MGLIYPNTIQNLSNQLTNGTFQVNGKVPLKKNLLAGGINLKKSISKP
jgi:hypothetical protein